MTNILFRIFYENEPISSTLLNRVEEVVVEQRIDHSWQARIKFRIYTDDLGNWVEEGKEFLKILSQIRVEIKPNNIESEYKALIEGKISSFDLDLNSEPNESIFTVLVQDETYFLNQIENIEIFEDKKDSEVVKTIFSQFSQISKYDIEETPKNPDSNIPHVVVQRGSALRLLKYLAKKHGKAVYVLPGNEPGESIGCFKSYPTSSDGQEELNSLVLLGNDRNLNSISIRHKLRLPSNFNSSALILSEKKIKESTSSLKDVSLLGEKIGYDLKGLNNFGLTQMTSSVSNIGNSFDLSSIASSAASTLADDKLFPTKLLFPDQSEETNPDDNVRAHANHISFVLEATVHINDDYPDILQPYSLISLTGVGPELSGTYLISQVLHRFNESEYSQTAHLLRNARSDNSLLSISSMLGDFI